MENIILIGILCAIAAAVIYFLVREKKKGKKCPGCPYGGKCSGGCKEK